MVTVQKQFWGLVAVDIILIVLVIALVSFPSRPIPQEASLVYKTRLPVGETGHKICSDQNRTCLGLKPITAYDANRQFYGYAQPDCNSQLKFDTSQRCQQRFGMEYVLTNMQYTRAPDSNSTADLSALTEICYRNSMYEFVYCVDQ